MNANPIRFRCPACKARIKAPAQLLGQSRPCPGCGRAFQVRPELPEDAGPHFVFREKQDHVTLDVVGF